MIFSEAWEALGLKGVEMETFTLDPRCWRIGVIFGRNPLIRRTDRIEALVKLVALVVALVTIPVAAVAGAMTYGAHDHLYAQEARERHTVMATVTDFGSDSRGATVLQGKWPVAAGERTGRLEVAHAAKVGDRTQMWVDKDGNPAASPTPKWQALADALAATVSALLLVAVGMTSLVVAMSSRIDQVRDAQWEREMTCLKEDGGRTNQH